MNFFPLLFFAIVQSAMAEMPQDHKTAIETARQGNPAKAIQIMEEIAKKKGWYDSLIYDYITILTWAKRDLEAYTVFHKKIVQKKQIPPYLMETMGGACRRLKLFNESRQFYHFLKEKEPLNPESDIGLAHIEMDTGHPHEAILILTRAEKKFPPHIDLYLSLAKAYYDIKEYSRSLLYYNKALGKNKNNPEAVQGQALCLNHLKSPFEALQKARQQSNNFSQKDIKEMEANRSASLILWGKIDKDNLKSFHERYIYLDRSITDLHRQLKTCEDPERTLRLQYDLIVAYVFRNRYHDAIKEYEKILASGKLLKDIPVYVLEGIGDTFLTLKQPEKAREVFDRILQENPKNAQAIIGFFYALIDSGLEEEALEFIKKNKDKSGKWIQLLDSVYQNRGRIMTEETYHSSFFYANLLEMADNISKEAIQTMPMNSEARALRGNVLLGRGLPRSAEMEYEIGLTNSPESTSLLLGKARAYLSLNEPENAKVIIDQVEKIYPENLDLKKVKKEWKSYHAAEFKSDSSFDMGGEAQNSGYGFTTDNRLYSPPFAHHYRAFLSGFYQFGTFDEGTLHHVKAGTGLEYRSRLLRILGEVNKGQGGKNRFGALLEAEYTPLDFLSVSTKAELSSRQTPGRALINNIHSHFYRVGVDYYQNESFQAGVYGFIQDFSDQNQWKAGGAYVQGRVREKPRHTVDLRLDVSARSSKNSDVPYYSPSKDRSIIFSSIFNQLLYQRYDHSFSHIITPDIGQYWQEGIGNRLIFGLSYEQRWKYQNWYEIGYGISRRRNFYDGSKQYATTFLLKMNIKF